MVLEVGSKAALIAHAGDVAIGGEDGFQSMEDFGAHAQAVGKRVRADGHDHEFLNVQVVGGVSAAVDDVHHGNGQHLGVDAADVLVQRQGQGFGGGAGRGERHAEHGVGAEAGLVVRAVQIQHGVVHLHLAQRVEAHDRFRDLGVHVFNGLADALAFITSLVSVAQFQRFAGPRGSPGRDGGTAYMTGIKGNFYLYRRIAARIKNFAGPN